MKITEKRNVQPSVFARTRLHFLGLLGKRRLVMVSDTRDLFHFWVCLLGIILITSITWILICWSTEVKVIYCIMYNIPDHLHNNPDLLYCIPDPVYYISDHAYNIPDLVTFFICITFLISCIILSCVLDSWYITLLCSLEETGRQMGPGIELDWRSA